MHVFTLGYIVLYCIVLYCIVLYCIVLYCIVLYCIVLYCIVLYCIVLYCIVLYCIVLVHTSAKLGQENLQSERGRNILFLRNLNTRAGLERAISDFPSRQH